MIDGVVVTRVVNSCVLLEFGEDAVLTDPWFTERWHLHHGEPLGLRVASLPRLTAIVASHSFVNHWDRRALRSFPNKKDTAVIVPTARMARQAVRVGFGQVECPSWGAALQISERVRVEVVQAHRTPSGRVSSYVFHTPGVRVFVGGEAERVEPLVSYGATHAPVDVALLPVNGLSVPFKGRIVMGPSEALEGAAALGASVLVPIHDAHHEDWPWRFIRRSGRAQDAAQLAAGRPGGPEVVDLPTGRRWDYRGRRLDPSPPSAAHRYDDAESSTDGSQR